MSRRLLLLLTALLALFAAPAADAAIQISIGDTDITAGGTGTIDLYLTPDADTNLSNFSFELSIDTPYGSDSLLQFFEPRPVYENDSNYVFEGATISGPSGDTGISSPAPQWFGFDVADIPGFVPLTANTSYLLARLNLQHSSLPDPYDPTGHQFEISLVDADFTQFSDENGEIDIDWINSTPGTVTILGGGAPVPEPGSLLIFAGLALCAVPCLRRRSR